MKTKRLQQMAVATFALLLAGTTAYAGDTRKNVYMNVEKIDHTVGVPPVLKTPQVPAVWIEGRELNCQGDHPAYVLSIIDSVGNLVYTTEIPESATQVTLPTEPLEGFTVEFVDGTWRLFGRLAPDGYRPMVVDGKTWKGYETNGVTGQRYRMDYYLLGDTTMAGIPSKNDTILFRGAADGKHYMKLYCYSERLAKKGIVQPMYLGGLREEDGKVYGTWESYGVKLDPQEVPIFDFGMEVGDSAYCALSSVPAGIQGCAFMASNRVCGVEDYYQNLHDYCIKLDSIVNITDDKDLPVRSYNFCAYGRILPQGGDNEFFRIPNALTWVEGLGAIGGYPFLGWETWWNWDLLWKDRFESSYTYELEKCFIDERQLPSSTPLLSAEERKDIRLTVWKLNPSSSVSGTAPKAPTVWLEGNTLKIEGNHPAYVLNITNVLGENVFKTNISTSTSEAELPIDLSDGIGIEFIQGSWSIKGILLHKSYRPLVVDGKTWKGYETDPETGRRYQMDYFLNGDIAWSGKAAESDPDYFTSSTRGKSYLKLYCNSERLAEMGIEQPLLIGVMRESDGMVYGAAFSYFRQNPDDDTLTEHLLFNYGMHQGDSAYCHAIRSTLESQGLDWMTSISPQMGMDYYGNQYKYYVKLDRIEKATENDGQELRKYYFSAHDKRTLEGTPSIHEFIHLPEAVKLVEGVGAVDGYPFLAFEAGENWPYWATRIDKAYTYELEKCFIDENLLSRGSTTGISPAEQMPAKAESSVLYDLQGRRIQGEPQKGMYIRGGKKYVKK